MTRLTELRPGTWLRLEGPTAVITCPSCALTGLPVPIPISCWHFHLTLHPDGTFSVAEEIRCPRGCGFAALIERSELLIGGVRPQSAGS